MDQSTLIFILIGLAVIAATVFALIAGSRKRSPEAITRDGKEQEISPVITGTGASPGDVPPPVPASEAPAAPPEIAVVPAPPPVPAGPPDELTRMKGVGPKVAALLNDLGVTRFDQIAAWDEADAARMDAQLGAFKGRIQRDQWVEQARLLAAGDTAAYEAKFGKLG